MAFTEDSIIMCISSDLPCFHSPSYYWVTSLEIVKEIKSGRAVKSKKKKKKALS